MDI
ncbi:hypothetical protein D030_1395A, partial [Vibrio parahaemolyticus AQ3810]|jgi:hypothetical protein